MAKLVFVHGVATRQGLGRDSAEATMRQLLAKTVFGNTPFEMLTPHWGDLVPSIRAEVFETGHAESYSVTGDNGEAEDFGPNGGGDVVGGTSVGAIAATRPELAIDAVLATVVERANAENRNLTDDEMIAFARAVDAVRDAVSARTLVGACVSDEELATALEGDPESYGISFTSVRDAVGRVADRISNVTSGLAYGLVAGSIRPAVGLYSGDVFAYLNDGELRANIRALVLADIEKAFAERSPGEPLILIGHSMGGVILVDMLGDPTAAGLPVDLHVDFLLTVGSQAGLFQSVGALTGGAPGSGKIPPRPCVRRWHNVFDPIDPLAFAAEPVFEAVEDLEFDSITGVASAHTTYFKRPQFYARLRERLSDMNLTPMTA